MPLPQPEVFSVEICKKCDGSGKVGKRREPCPRCKGSGKFQRRVKEGE